MEPSNEELSAEVDWDDIYCPVVDPVVTLVAVAIIVIAALPTTWMILKSLKLNVYTYLTGNKHD